MWIEPPQSIPAELMELYLGVLVRKYSDTYVRRRYPWEVKIYDDYPPGGTPLQRFNRARFQNCVRCFNAQPFSGGVEPPEKGPRSRQWWYSQAGAMWYYNYFIQQSMNIYLDNNTPDWCQDTILGTNYVDSLYPDTNYVYSPNLHVHKCSSPQREMRTYIKTNGTLFLQMSCLPNSPTFGPGWSDYFHIKIYDVPYDYNPFDITWNNQPGYLNHHANQAIKWKYGYGRIAIYFGNCPKAFCIVGAFDWVTTFSLYSIWMTVPERPYWIA